MNFISSFFDNIKDKTTNPFFGTLILVWLVRNWELVYTVFNFDEKYNLKAKKDFINGYYKDYPLGKEMLINISIAFGLMILSYGLIILSRLVVNVTNHNIIPRMNEKTVSKLVVNKARFETVKKTRDEYFAKIQDFEEQVIALEQKNSLLKKTNIEQESKNQENIRSIRETNKALTDSAKKNDEYEAELLKSNASIIEINAKTNSDAANYNELRSIILDYVNGLDILSFESYENINFPKEIKDAYLVLNGDSTGNSNGIGTKIKLFNQLTNVDVRFFDIAENITMNAGQGFDYIYIRYYIKIGLIQFKQEYEGNLDIKVFYTHDLKLTVLGELVFATENIYFALKKNEVLN